MAPVYRAAMPDTDTFADTLTVRPLTADDVGAVLALSRADEERATGRPSQLTEGDVRDWWQRLDLTTDSWMLTAPGAPEPVAVAWLEKAGDELGFTFPVVTRDRDATLPLALDLVERRAVEQGLQRLHVSTYVPDEPADRVLTGRGYREVRRFYEMAIELDTPPPAARLPEGLTLRSVTEEDAREFHATIGEAFEDHWEHHPMPFDEWWAMRSQDPDVDLSWWFAVHEGDRMVAAIRNVPARNGGVYVATLGVRRAWRGHGLAKALLAHTFRRAVEAGFPRVTLGVDASSPTGATALYRSVGMTEELESAVWERSLADL